MQHLATLYRTAQFLAHNAHNLASGPTFFEDHEEFGKLYPAYEGAYDDVVERMLGLGQTPNLDKILDDSARLASAAGEGKDSAERFSGLLKMERLIQAEIKGLVPDASNGTQDLLQGLANDSEKRVYLLGRRMAE